jgi:3-deoxy-D-manno-octulosonate 8-phosphate phosphatase (KDO 8-P phosphatase)
VKLLILDVDGVLTDGKVVLGTDGLELKHFHTLDGFGIARAHEKGLIVAFITARVSEAVETRALELGVKDFLQGRRDKVEAYEHLLEKHHLSDDQVAYVGDDLFDLPVLSRAGLKVAVANAVTPLKRAADYVTLAPGGHGAVREVIELLLGWRDLKESQAGGEGQNEKKHV